MSPYPAGTCTSMAKGPTHSGLGLSGRTCAVYNAPACRGCQMSLATSQNAIYLSKRGFTMRWMTGPR